MKGYAAIIGFVTRDNVSAKGLAHRGALAIPSFYIVSAPGRRPASRPARDGLARCAPERLTAAFAQRESSHPAGHALSLYLLRRLAPAVHRSARPGSRPAAGSRLAGVGRDGPRHGSAAVACLPAREGDRGHRADWQPRAPRRSGSSSCTRSTRCIAAAAQAHRTRDAAGLSHVMADRPPHRGLEQTRQCVLERTIRRSTVGGSAAAAARAPRSRCWRWVASQRRPQRPASSRTDSC